MKTTMEEMKNGITDAYLEIKKC